MEIVHREARSRISRRGFVMGAAAAGIVASLGQSTAEAVQRDEMRGTHFELTVEEQWVNLTGRRRRATVVR